MEDNVKVYINAKQESLGEEGMEMVTTGQLKEKDGKLYLTYIDSMLDEEKQIKTMVKVDGDKVSIIRYGENQSHLLFEKGISHITPYETPFGYMEMISHTHDIGLTQTDGGFELFIDYQVEMNRSKLGRNQLQVVATPLKK